MVGDEIYTSLEDLKEKIKSYAGSDLELIDNAFSFAHRAHAGQQRVSGASYITHPLGVSKILAELQLDMATLVAGLLHDVVEDTGTTLKELEEEFGYEVALLVDGVTKLSRLEFSSKEEQQAENLRKMFLAMAKDIRVVLIKLADRTHNMRTLRYLKSSKQAEIARETLDIYAPLAHRLGIYKIKWELEDLAFRYLNPEDYYSLVDKLAKKRQEREAFINNIIAGLQQRLQELKIKADIQGRAKHLYSIYTKMKEQNKDFSEIYDLTAVRILVDDVKDCYAALGVIHTMWKPIPGRFKDYIAMPKPNMYQSLHTTVMVAKNELLEVQIRTWDMHRTAEYGIAAHWRYKEKVKDEGDLQEKFSWLRQLLEWQQEYRDAQEFIENLKIDLFSDEVFVFTPKGDVIDLPAGSVPLDFAYRIHTDIGNRCVGARVNGRLVPLNHRLQTGDIVEVITSKQASPSRDWLNMVQSSTAKSKIRGWFKKERREENMEKGRSSLEKEIKHMNLDPHQLLKEELLLPVGKRFNLQTVDDIYAAIGYGGVSVQQVITRLQEEYRKLHGEDEKAQEIEIRPWKEKKAPQGIRIQGIDNLLVRFARCCNPVPGDDIIGFITRGRGVTVHRRDCPNLKSQIKEDSKRMLDVEWEHEDLSAYPVDIRVLGMDRPNLLTELMTIVNDSKIDITAVHGRSDKNRIATVQLTVVVKDRPQLEHLINKLRRVRDVFEVGRFSSSEKTG